MTTMKNQEALKNKRKREGAGKRSNMLLKKAYELGKLPEIDVFVVINNRGRYSTYKSVSRESWPPTMAEIVSGAGVRL